MTFSFYRNSYLVYRKKMLTKQLHEVIICKRTCESVGMVDKHV